MNISDYSQVENFFEQAFYFILSCDHTMLHEKLSDIRHITSQSETSRQLSSRKIMPRILS